MTEKSCSKCKQIKARSAFGKRKAAKDGLRFDCKECVNSYGEKYREENRPVIQARQKEWLAANVETTRAYSKNFRAKNPEKAAAWARRWQEANRDSELKRQAKRYQDNRATILARNAAYQKADPVRNLLWTRAYQARQLKATPAWASPAKIAEVYRLAEKLAKATGYKFHVDHIVPLRGKTVCGLHVEHNLQVMLASVNQSKSNRFWPDMPI